MGVAGVAAGVGATAAVASAASSIAKGSGASSTQSAADAQGADANALAQQASNLFANINTPNLNTTPLQDETWLQNFVPQTYTPWIGQATQIQDDPASAAAENAALGQMQQFAKGGLQPSDLLLLEQIQQQQANAGTSGSLAATNQLQTQGLGGSGASYAAQLAANQAAANSSQSLYANAAQAAMARQTAAINSAGTMAGNIRNQDVSISSQMAAINNAFNTQVQNLRTNAAANAASVNNAATAANLAGQQGVANTNVTTANQNVALQNSLMQQNFGNQTTLATDQANALNKQQTLASANQAALNTQALGQDQSTTAGLNGLASLAKSVAPTTSASGTSTPSGLQTLWNSITGSGSSNNIDSGTWDTTSGSGSTPDTSADTWDLSS